MSGISEPARALCRALRHTQLIGIWQLRGTLQQEQVQVRQESPVSYFYLELADGRFVRLGEYFDLDPLASASETEIRSLQKLVDSARASLVIDKTIDGVFVDALQQVVIKMENGAIMWVRPGDDEMILEVEMLRELAPDMFPGLTLVE